MKPGVGIAVDAEKVRQLLALPAPRQGRRQRSSVSALRSFLGLANYYQQFAKGAADYWRRRVWKHVGCAEEGGSGRIPGRWAARRSRQRSGAVEKILAEPAGAAVSRTGMRAFFRAHGRVPDRGMGAVLAQQGRRRRLPADCIHGLGLPRSGALE